MFRAGDGEWTWLENAGPSLPQPTPGGPPLGLLPSAEYRRMILKHQAGDLMVLYSDGVSEATNPEGEELGRKGLMRVLQSLNSRSAAGLGSELAMALQGFRGGPDFADDHTIVILERLAAVQSSSPTS